MKKRLSLELCFSFIWMLTFTACSSGNEDEPTPPQVEAPKIEIDASQSSPVIEQKGGSATVSITATSNWTADTGTIDWCNVSPTNGAAGSHTLTVTATANNTYDERRATVTLHCGQATKSFTVTQKQKDALTVTSNKIEMKANGGEAIIEIKANVNYQYDIEESARTWISIANTRGLSTTTLKLNIAENDHSEKREGTITIQSGDLSEKITIYQEGCKPAIILTQNEYTVDSKGETITVELKSNIDYEVQLPAESWITESDTRALSSHTHHFTITANEEYDARTAEITFINKENNLTEKVKVTQMQRDAIIVAKHEYTVPATGGELDFAVSTNIDFTVESSVDWIKQVTTRGLTDKTLHFTIEENQSDNAREGTITISKGDLKQTVKVTQQAKAIFAISQNEAIVEADGGQIQIAVTANGEYTVQLPNVSWIKETTTKGATTHTHTFCIAANETYENRTAEIIFTDKKNNLTETVKVTQMQRDAIIVAQNEYAVPADGGKLDFTVSTNVDFTVESSVNWIKQVTTRGLTNKDLHFTIEENPSDDVREGTITISKEALKQIIKVTQQAKVVFAISQNEATVEANGGQIQVKVTTNGEYTVQLPNVNWITETTTRGTTTHTHTFRIAANETYESRTAEIIFADKRTGNIEKMRITQMPNSIKKKRLIQDMEFESLDDISYYHYAADGWLEKVVKSPDDEGYIATCYYSYSKQNDDIYVTETDENGEITNRYMFNDRIRTINGEECIYDSEDHLIQCGNAKFTWKNGNIIEREDLYGRKETYTYYMDKENKHPVYPDPIIYTFESYFLMAHPHLLGKYSKNLVKKASEDAGTYSYKLDADGYVLSYKCEGEEHNDFNYKWE